MKRVAKEIMRIGALRQMFTFEMRGCEGSVLAQRGSKEGKKMKEERRRNERLEGRNKGMAQRERERE